jgi:uncharacterized protein YdeI (YjbR/CyaY-like superfamily)
MANKSKEIDAYIAKSAPFAGPILKHLRQLVHGACPEAEEKMKWGFPHFDYRGQMMCSMAAFKQHAVFGFWKAGLMKDKSLHETAKSEVAMGHLGRITSLNDLPADKKIITWIKEAMKLNDEGIKMEKPKTAPGIRELTVPAYMTNALKKNKKAMEIFKGFNYSNKKEYVEWVAGSKTAETRQKRLEQAVEWMSEGKIRNWKYTGK